MAYNHQVMVYIKFWLILTKFWLVVNCHPNDDGLHGSRLHDGACVPDHDFVWPIARRFDFVWQIAGWFDFVLQIAGWFDFVWPIAAWFDFVLLTVFSVVR